MINSVFEFLKDMSNTSWQGLLKISIVMITSFLSLVLYDIYSKQLILVSTSEKIVFDEFQKREMTIILNKILRNKEVEAVGLFIYQPNNIPKKRVDVAFMKGKNRFQDGKILNMFFKSRDFKNSNTFIYNKLQYKETFKIDKKLNNSTARFMRYNEEIADLVVFGLYKYSSPYAVMGIAFNKKAGIETIEIINKDVRLIEQIAFNQ